MRILIIEDNIAQAESLQLAIKTTRPEMNIFLAPNADAAQAIVQTHPPDVIVLDWIIPGGGLAFLDWLHNTKGVSPVPVVVSTGLSIDQVQKLASYGVNKALQKPYRVEDLLQAIDQVAHGRLGP